jgi:micrococcal nuclease
MKILIRSVFSAVFKRFPKSKKSKLAILMMLCGFMFLRWVTSVPTNEMQEVTRIPAKIIEVVDGDTMRVSIDGKKETIRLLLIDTPETVHPSKSVEPFGPEASAFAKKTLSGKAVEIEKDVSERDKYGRLLCYLYIDGKMFNEMLLEKGLARVAYVYPPNVKYVEPFRDIQKNTQQKGIGIWSIENYAQENGFQDKSEINPSNNLLNDSASASNNDDKNTFQSCAEAKSAGKVPLYKGTPGYNKKLDRDGDGVACES